MQTLNVKGVLTCIATTTLLFAVGCGSDVGDGNETDESVKVTPVESTAAPQTLGGLNTYPYKCPADCFSASTLEECTANCSTKCVTTTAHLNCL